MSTSEGQPDSQADQSKDEVEGHLHSFGAARADGDSAGDDDVEGHVHSMADGDTAGDDDVEGHLGAARAGEGHLMRGDEEADDTEGHVQKF